MTISTTALGMSFAFILAGCNSDTSMGPDADNASTAMIDNQEVAADVVATENSAGNALVTETLTAQQFADTAAASDAYELASSKLAIDKAQAAGVKDFARQMVKDHTASTAKLKAAAGSIVPNAAMNPEQQANLEALQGATGDAFDKNYLGQQLAAHQKALAALTGYADAGDNAALKAHAAATAPVVQGHLTMLQGM